MELYCGVCVIFFWINTSLKSSQIGLSSDRVTSMPGTAAQGLGAEGTESVWISGALTFWNNGLGNQSSPGFQFPFQDAESPAETLPGSGCSLAVLRQGRAWPGPAGGRGTGMGDDTAGISFPRNPPLWSYPGRNRAVTKGGRARRAPVRPQSKPPAARTQSKELQTDGTLPVSACDTFYSTEQRQVDLSHFTFPYI